MKYSPALTAFGNRLTEVATLLRLCTPLNASLTTKSKSRNKDIVLCRAALVLLSSHMEGFFEDLIQDILQFYELINTQFSNLPLRIRVVQIKKRITAIETATDKRIWEAVQQIRTSDIADDSLICTPGNLNLDNHIRGFSNPGSKEVKELFKSIGIEDIWELLKRKRFRVKILKATLDSLVNKRNPIAHGNIAVTVTPNDIKQYITDMKKLAKKFDKIIQLHLTDESGYPNPWSIFN